MTKYKKKTTISATSQGIEKAEKALVRLGFVSKKDFSDSTLIGRNTVTNFFLYRKIKVDSFKRICEKLTLDWKEIADLTVEESQTSVTRQANKDLESILISTRQVTVKDKQSGTIKAILTLQSNLDSIENLNILI